MTGLARYEMLIDGKLCDPNEGCLRPSINPVTEDVWAGFPEATAADVDRAVQAAQRAFEDGPWRRMSPAERGKRLKKLGQLIAPKAELLGRAETTDTGMLYRKTRWRAQPPADPFVMR